MTGYGGTRYQEMELEGMSPARRVVFLYNRLVGALRKARGHMERKEIEPRTQQILHAHACLETLLHSLDRERGGALAQDLAALYSWFMAELLRINMKPDLGRLDHVLGLVQDLQQAWIQVAAQATAELVP
jgi:flagellar secretion chaperone FliS